MDYQDHLKIVEKMMDKLEILSQLAEEAVELARAVFEFDEKGTGKIPHYRGEISPFLYRRFQADTWTAVREETADTLVSMDVLKNVFFSPEESGIVDSVLVSFTVVADSLPDKEKLSLLIKNALDLSKAALKMRRALGAGSPTPITEEQAKQKLLCCCAAVLAIVRIIFDEHEDRWLEETKNEKAERWSKRLRGEANA